MASTVDDTVAMKQAEKAARVAMHPHVSLAWDAEGGEKKSLSFVADDNEDDKKLPARPSSNISDSSDIVPGAKRAGNDETYQVEKEGDPKKPAENAAGSEYPCNPSAVARSSGGIEFSDHPETSDEERASATGAIMDYPEANRALSRPGPGAYLGAPGASFVQTDEFRHSALGRPSGERYASSKSCFSVNASYRNGLKGLSVATPVDLLAFDDLPAAEEMDESEVRTITDEIIDAKRTKKHMALGVMATLLLCGIILLLVFLLADEDNESVATTQTTVNPTIAPTLSSADYVLQMLPASTSRTIQLHPQSPQAQALQWVLDDPKPPQSYEPHRLQQRFVLVTIYYSTNGPGWRNNSNWLDYTVDECGWYHKPTYALKDVMPAFYRGYMEDYDPGTLSCPDNSTLEYLWLDQNNLKGNIPFEELAMLTSLKSFSIGLNNLEGPISSVIGTMSNLESFSIFSLKNGGMIPTEVGLLSKLVVFQVNDNNHFGTIPTEIQRLSHLKNFFASSNRLLEGAIPTFGGFSNLRWLALDACSFTGTIPSELGNTQALDLLALGSNKLSGSIPSELGHLSMMKTMLLGRNALSGTLPSQLGKLSLTSQMTFRENRLTGSIPSQLGLLTLLKQALNLQNNFLTGSIPTELSNLVLVEELSLGNNQLSMSIPKELSSLSRLTFLGLSNNSLTGVVPHELSGLVNPSLYLFAIDGNPGLSGIVPEMLCAVNGTCREHTINKCEGRSGFIFDCTEVLCGCGCACNRTLRR